MAAIGTSFNIFNTNATDPKTATLTAATAGDLIVIVCAYTGQTAAPVITDDQSGTYTEVLGGALKNASADAAWIFIRDALLPATQSTIVSAARASTTGGGMVIFRVSGMTRVGTDAVRNWATTPQRGKQENQAASGTPAPALPAAALTGNPTLGFVFNATNPATLTPNASWTEKADIGYNTPTTGLEVVGRDSGFTGTTVTWGGTSGSAFASAIIELDSSAPAGVDATVTPATIARAFVVDQAGPSAGSSVTPATVARSFIVDQAEARAASSVTPATVTQSVAVPQATAGAAGVSATPATVARAFLVPQAEPRAAASVTPATVARAFLVPQAEGRAGASLTPATITRAFVVPQATAGAATAVTPATIARAFLVPQAGVQAGVTLTPATIARAFALPQADPRAGATLTPTTIARAFGVPQVAAGAGISITPTTIARAFAVPQASAQAAASATVTPATIAALASLPQASVQAGVIVVPTTIGLVVAFPQTRTILVLPLIWTHEGPQAGGAAAGSVLTVTREGDKAGGAASGAVLVVTREGS